MDTWRFLEARRCVIGGSSCLAIRISYTGELGWEIYPAMEDMTGVYQAIVDNGGDLGLGHVGTRVINTLRIEKGFFFFKKEDITNMVCKDSELGAEK